MTQEEPEATVTWYVRCPVCGTTSEDPNDVRFGYCWTCHDFTGEPTDIVLFDDPEFGRRVSDRVREQWRLNPPRVLTAAEREDIWRKNRAAFSAHMRALLMVEPPSAYTNLSLFATAPERDTNPPPPQSWWSRLMRWIRSRRR